MGSVYLGRDPELDRQVAIKVIREEVHDQEVLDRFFREARAAAALRHPNIITIYASGQHEHQPYMAMEFVDGESLADIIKQRRSLSLADKLSYIDQVCAGLHFAHRAGIVHRDIKPANVMVDREGVVRILDFGIARIEGSAMTQDGAMIGSLNYMSPEQMLGRPVDLRSDIFSVGTVAYELLCYQQAFRGSLTDGLLQRLPHEDPPSLSGLYPGLTPEIERVITRALEKAPENRFQSLADMRSALASAQAGAQPSDDRTVMIPRHGAAAATPPTVTPPPTTPSASLPLPPPPFPVAAVEPPRPATSVTVPSGSRHPGSAAPTTTSATGTGTQGIQLKKATTIALKPSTTIAKPPSTVIRHPPPTTPPRSRSRMWILVGSGGAALIVAIVAALPWLTAAPPGLMEREGPAVEAAMDRFRSAYRNRNLEGIVGIFPTLPPAAKQRMQHSFDECLVYEVTFDGLQVEMNPSDEKRAEVDVRSTHTCTPNSGGRQTVTPQHERFTLRKNGDTWLIDSVARAGDGSTNRPN